MLQVWACSAWCEGRRRSPPADLCDALWIQALAVRLREVCVLARRGGPADGRAFHLLDGLVAADVGQTAVAGASASLWAVHGHVRSSSQKFPWAVVAHHRGTQIWVAMTTMGTTVSVVALGRMDHAV